MNPSFIAIDPGGYQLGVAVYEFDPSTLELNVPHVGTFKPERHTSTIEYLEEIHGGRYTRMTAIEDHLSRLLDHYKPLWVVIETPYLGRLPQAFEALLDCVGAVRRAILKHDYLVPLYEVTPSQAKAGVGSKDSSKEAVALAVSELGLLPDVKHLDEHSTDAMAVGYTMFNNLYKGAKSESEKRPTGRRKGRGKRRSKRHNSGKT